MLKYDAHLFDAITNGLTGTVERMSFDALGRRWNATDYTNNNLPTYFVSDREGVVPGFIGQQVDAFRWKNMLSEAKSREQSDTGNGRVYDPCQGRFLSPDVLVQSPDFTQDYNRYSYVLNNPLKYTDPSGYLPDKFLPYLAEYYQVLSQAETYRYQQEMDAVRRGPGIFTLNEWWTTAQHYSGPGFNDLYVRDVNGNWIRKEKAVDVTGNGDYVNRDEIQQYGGDIAAIVLWAMGVYNNVQQLAYDGNSFGGAIGIDIGQYHLSAEYAAQNGNFKVVFSGVDVVFQRMVPAGGGGGWLDNIQAVLDVAGIADPTGIVDCVNALIYAGRGQWGNAGISALAIIPYIGDVGKAGRLGAKTLQLTSRARTAENGLELAGKFLKLGYTEIAPGVFRSSDQLRQFRMKTSDITGAHGPGPHFHFEIFSPLNLNKAAKNYHVPIINP